MLSYSCLETRMVSLRPKCTANLLSPRQMSVKQIIHILLLFSLLDLLFLPLRAFGTNGEDNGVEEEDEAASSTSMPLSSFPLFSALSESSSLPQPPFSEHPLSFWPNAKLSPFSKDSSLWSRALTLARQSSCSRRKRLEG